jgi:hypothetical protein
MSPLRGLKKAENHPIFFRKKMNENEKNPNQWDNSCLDYF